MTDFWEAEWLAERVPRDRCPSTDAIELLDANPGIRLALEDTWTDAQGRVYREVEAGPPSRWSAPIARAFRALLALSKDPGQTIRLLDLLQALEADERTVRMFLTGCRRRGSLAPGIRYLESLVAELPTLPKDDVEAVPLAELQAQPVPLNGAVAARWRLRDRRRETSEATVSPCHRPDLLYDPSAVELVPWCDRQPKAWRRLYRRIRAASARQLPALKAELLGQPGDRWTPDQLRVVWEAYRFRRDQIRAEEARRVRRALSPMARALVRRIQRVRSRAELGRVGQGLYEAMAGRLRLPGAISQPEWAVVFDRYRARKAALVKVPGFAGDVSRRPPEVSQQGKGERRNPL